MKGRKGEKEIGILNFYGAQSPEERECRRESENSRPNRCLASGQVNFRPLDESKYNTQKYICQVFCQKFFLENIFCPHIMGIHTNESKLNLFKITTIIRKLNWKTV